MIFAGMKCSAEAEPFPNWIRNINIKIIVFTQKELKTWWVYITSHAQRYRIFTLPAVVTGQVWQIPLNEALRLTTPHFAKGVLL